ncbi:unnamed protein product [Sphagnum troendelagicum]|uniref:Uncharacterized protein n=1 Tax=Sphagnum troendelagicum TaxID=128251 RepID=A0ABP0TF80_9BRYO
MEAHQYSKIPGAFPFRHPLESNLGPPMPGPVILAGPYGCRLVPVNLRNGGYAEGREHLLSLVQVLIAFFGPAHGFLSDKDVVEDKSSFHKSGLVRSDDVRDDHL